MLTLFLCSLAGIALARMDGFSLAWWTVDSGGGTSSNADFSLSGTIGQPDAGRSRIAALRSKAVSGVSRPCSRACSFH